MRIIRNTFDTERFRHIYTKPGNKDKIRWTGFIHPLNATIKLATNSSVIYTFKMLVENVSVNVNVSRDDTIDAAVSFIHWCAYELIPYTWHMCEH